MEHLRVYRASIAFSCCELRRKFIAFERAERLFSSLVARRQTGKSHLAFAQAPSTKLSSKLLHRRCQSCTVVSGALTLNTGMHATVVIRNRTPICLINGDDFVSAVMALRYAARC